MNQLVALRLLSKACHDIEREALALTSSGAVHNALADTATGCKLARTMQPRQARVTSKSELPSLFFFIVARAAVARARKLRASVKMQPDLAQRCKFNWQRRCCAPPAAACC